MRILRGRLLAAAALGAAAIVATVGAPAFPAVSSLSPPAYLDIGDAGTVVARGAAVDIPVVIVCSPRAYPELAIQVTERVGSAIASGSAYLANQALCTGIPQTTTFRVHTSSAKAFKKGTALVTVQLTIYNYGYVQLVDSATIPIK